MRSTKFKVIVGFLSLAIVLVIFPSFNSFADTVASGSCGDSLTWTLDSNGTLTISGSGSMKDYNDEEVPWVNYRDSIKSLSLSNNLTYIGRYSFARCPNLTSVAIPKNVKTIGRWAFAFDYGLTSVSIPNGVTKIGWDAFRQCTSLKSIVIPDSVTTIEDMVFYKCTSLTSVTLPKGLTKIDKQFFDGCKKLASITIPESVTSIGESAFKNCTSLTNIVIPSGVTSIGDDAFSGCTGLTSIVVDKNLFTQDAFPGITSESVQYYYDVKYANSENGTVSGRTKAYSNQVFEISINPNNHYGIQSVRMKYNSKTIVISADSNGKYYCTMPDYEEGIVIDVLFKKISDSGRCGLNMTWNYVLSTGVLTISGSGDMYDASASTEPPWYDYSKNITSVVFKGEITSIGKYAFKGCSKLTSISIPNTVTKIGYWAFIGCGFTSIEIPGSVTSVGDKAFANCKNLTDVKLADGFSKIGWEMFDDCTNLKSISIPNSVTRMTYAFNNCQSLKKVTLPESITTIEGSAFKGCGITEIVIPESVTSVGKGAFDSCTGLKKIVISKDVYNENITDRTGVKICYYYNVKYINDGHGTITGSTRSYGTNTNKLQINPSNNYVIDQVTWTNGNESGVLSPDLNGNCSMPCSDATITIKATFKTKYTVKVNNPENGTVSLSRTEAGLGDEITVSTSPNIGYKLDAIKVNGETISGNTFTMPAQNVLVEVTFVKIVYTISVADYTIGTAIASKTTANYGDEITLTPKPNIGYELITVIVNGNTITGTTFTMPNKNVYVELRFQKISYSIVVNETTGGSVTPDRTSANYQNTVKLTITPDEEYELDEIKINGSTIKGNSFSMPADNVTVDVTFKRKVYNISFDNVSNGSVSASKISASSGELISLTATPNTGYKLSYFKLDGVKIEGESFTMPSKNVSVGAYFTKIKYSITLIKSVGGDAVVNKNTASMGEVVSITVTPDEGYELDSILVNGVAINNTFKSFEMEARDATVEVTFRKIEYSIYVSTTTVNSVPCGTVELSKNKANAGDKITIKATPNIGYELAGIYVNNTVIDGNEFTMGAGDARVSVLFSQIEYNVSINSSTGGRATVTASVGTKYYYGTKAIVSTSPEAGYMLDKIKVNGTVIDGKEFTIGDSDVTIEVSFKKIEYTITLVTTEGGTATLSKTKAYAGDEIKISATPKDGYRLGSIQVGNGYCNLVDGEYKFTQSYSDVTVTVSFIKKLYTVKLNAVNNGSAKVSSDMAGIGDEITVNANPNAGYELDYISVNGKPISGTKFTMSAQNTNVDVYFIKHDLSKISAKAATCTEDGYKEHYKCSRCHKLFSDADGKNEIITPEVIKALGHAWDEGEVIEAPTCENGGVKTLKCTREGCKETKTEPISPLGHNKIVEVPEKAPTKTEPGNIKHYMCERCGKLFSDAKGKNPITKEQTIIPAMGHDLTAVKAHAATCTEPGNTAYYICKDDDCKCGKVYSDPYGQHEINIEDTVIPALGHNPKEVAGKDPTCTEDGHEKYYKCSRCNKLFSDADGKNEIEKPVVIPKLGHAMTHIDAQKPTHEDDGHKAYYHCSRCGKNFADEEGKTEMTDAEIVVPHIGAAVLGEEITEGDFIYKVTNPRTDGTGTVTIIGVANKTAAVIIPATVELKLDTYKVNRIGTKAFYGNKTITSLSIGSNVVVIDSYAFYGCSNLVKVSGGKVLKTIGTKAFAYCSKLKSFSISSSVLNKIGSYAFQKDKKLKTVYIKYTTKLTKSGVKKSLKGSSVKTVKVKKSKVKKFKKYFKKSNSGRKVKVKK